MALDVLTINIPSKGNKDQKQERNECLNLAVVFSATGSIHVFRLLSDEELSLYEISYHQLQKDDRSITNSFEVLNGILNSVIPSNISKMTMNRSEVRVRLSEIPDFSSKNKSLMASAVESGKDSMVQSSQVKLTAVDIFDPKSRNKATADSVLRGLPYVAFIQ